MLFSYKDLSTIEENGKRYYQCPEANYPSITTVLGHTMADEKRKSLEDWRNSFGHERADKFTEDAATRGTFVHEMVEKHFLNTLDISSYDKKYVSMFNSLKFELRNVKEVLGLEVALYSNTLKVAGRSDMIAFHKDDLSIVDLKTTGRIKSEEDVADYWLQIAFYAIAHNEMFKTQINQGVILMANENGLPQRFICKDLSAHYSGLIKRIEEFYNVY